MKKVAMLVVLALVVGMAFAPAMANDEKNTTAMKGKTHDVTVEVISMDMKANTMTVKGEDGKPMTVPVMGQAIKEMANVKPGEKVTVACMDNEKGEHQGITHIKMAMAKTEKK